MWTLVDDPIETPKCIGTTLYEWRTPSIGCMISDYGSTRHCAQSVSGTFTCVRPVPSHFSSSSPAAWLCMAAGRWRRNGIAPRQRDPTARSASRNSRDATENECRRAEGAHLWFGAWDGQRPPPRSPRQRPRRKSGLSRRNTQKHRTSPANADCMSSVQPDSPRYAHVSCSRRRGLLVAAQAATPRASCVGVSRGPLAARGQPPPWSSSTLSALGPPSLTSRRTARRPSLGTRISGTRPSTTSFTAKFTALCSAATPGMKRTRARTSLSLVHRADARGLSRAQPIHRSILSPSHSSCPPAPPRHLARVRRAPSQRHRAKRHLVHVDRARRRCQPHQGAVSALRPS
jgi:hypothetical protein